MATMTDVYTRISKPTDKTYVNVNGQGREQYDQADLTYDSSTFYDGVDMNAYTSITKPTLDLWSAFTLPWLLPLPWQVTGGSYTNILKPTT
jgi:hypothetical protein